MYWLLLVYLAVIEQDLTIYWIPLKYQTDFLRRGVIDLPTDCFSQLPAVAHHPHGCKSA